MQGTTISFVLGPLKRRRIYRALHWRLLVFVLAATFTHASAAVHSIDAGLIYFDLSDGLESTYGAYVRGRYGSSPRNAWTADITNLNRFGDNGTQFTGGNIHHFNERIYTQLYLAGSSGGFFWPRIRVDGSLSIKWLDSKRFVTTLGAGYFDAKDVHEDTRGFIDLSYYSNSPFVFHGGVQLNVSDPGSVDSISGYLGLSYVKNGDRIVSLRGSFGDQAYQAVTANNFVVDFPFHSVRATWREWVGDTWGINLAAEHYASDVYDQDGIEIGLFKEF